MGTRLALAVCIVIGCTLCGRALASAARRRAAALREIADGLRLLKVSMVSMFEPVRESLSRSDCGLLRQVGEAMAGGLSADGAWQAVKPRARRSGGAIDALAAEDIAALDRLFSHLGQSGREVQELLIASVLRDLEARLEEARRKSGEADRLYLSLGLLVGLMLALIVV